MAHLIVFQESPLSASGLIDEVSRTCYCQEETCPTGAQCRNGQSKVERIKPNERTVGRSGGLFVLDSFIWRSRPFATRAMIQRKPPSNVIVW